ncbi:unnamed protein product [Schistocephalus solidus]|uniref:RNA helicase n=1 Tax=Schistocephalus solidus TaxID=70667 RepID=A0A183SYK4_SCHSO|nr:unnamed protein product [Schistocephalus solidus]
MSFRRLGVCPEIVELLRDKGIIVPSEVQLGCIPPILEDFLYNDVLSNFLQRELAHQIGEQTAGLNLVQGSPICTVQVITGGRNIVQQSVQLSQGPHVVVATPGRLADLLRTQKAAGPNSEQEWSLSRLKVLVLDEADRLLEDNFGKDLAEIMTSLPKVRQSLLFSATFSPAIKTAVEAARMKALSENRRPPLVWQAKGIEAVAPGATAATVDTLSQHYLITKPELKEAFLVYIVDQFLTESPHSLIIIFSNKCKWCHLLGLIMSAVGIQSAVLHSSMPQRDRITALTSFKSSHIRVLIARDLASRGFYFPTVDAKGLEAVAPGATAATVDTLSQHYLITKPELKEAFLVYIVDQFLTESPHSLIIIFSNKCKWCHLLGLIMSAVGIQSAVLHSSMPQRDRITALTSFKSSHIRVLIATDLASRGLDFPTVDVVINHNVPIRPKDYVHRVGRTARAGKAGMALTLADLFEIKRLRAIQTYIGKKLQRFEVNESQVAKIIAEVTIARRNAERLLKAQSSKKMT